MTDIPEVQRKIDELQNSFHDKTDDIMTERDLKRNALYAARTAILKEKGPKNFWSLVIQSHEDISMELAGPYDAAIFDKLEDFDVTYTEAGFKLTMKFGRNDFFEDKELWAEDVNGDIKFSGIHWKDGKGPYTDEEEEAAATQAGSNKKRDRDDRGASLFEVFAEMMPHPEDDEEMDEEDDEEIEDLVDQWEEELEDRKEVLGCLVDEVWADPANILARAALQEK